MVLTCKFDTSDWFIDSGATNHMTMHREWITGQKKYSLEAIRAANNDLMEVEFSGEVNLKIDVCVEINLTTNLLSVSKIAEKGCLVNFTSKSCTICDKHGSLLATASSVGGLFKLNAVKNVGGDEYEKWCCEWCIVCR